MYPDRSPAAPPPIRPPAPSRPATDPVAAIAGNATMLGIGYMFMRRPVLTALALSGTGFLSWSAAVQTENPLWRLLLPPWALFMILHAWWLTRRARTERLVDLAEPDPARRSRVFAVTAAALVLLTTAWFRLDAWWIAHDAEAAHAEGDCESATAALRSLDPVHRVAFGPITLRGEEEREACELLLTALDETPAEAAELLEEYMDHPGARWEGAGTERAASLFEAALSSNGSDLSLVSEAFAQLHATLEEFSGQSAAVREAVGEFMADLAEAPPCGGRQVDEWLSARSWEDPAFTEPIAAAADQVPLRLLGCAREHAASGDATGAGSLYREFLTDHPTHELAGEAADGVLDSGTYCGDPVAYPGAPEYGGEGPHPMRLLGVRERGFPDSWSAATAEETTLVVCVTSEVGRFQDSCRYITPSGESFWTTFYAHRFDIKAYEFKTGTLVADYTREIGDPCPELLDGTYTTIYFVSHGNGVSAMASEYTDEAFRGMFADLMD